MKKLEYLKFKYLLERAIGVGKNFDAVSHPIDHQKFKGEIFFLSSLTDPQQLSELIKSLSLMKSLKELETEIAVGSVTYSSNCESLVSSLQSGNAILLLKKASTPIIIEMRSYPSRAVAEPPTEKAVRGSRDGFNESINTNLGLIRRRIRTDKLSIHLHKVGTESKTDVAVLYLDDRVPEQLLETINGEIEKINVTSLTMADRALEELIFPQYYCPFPLARYTERPDIAAIELMRGKILIMVDCSASVIITPTSLVDHMKHVEEYRQTPLIGSFIRLLRALAIMISVFLVPLWLALIEYTDVQNLFIIRPSTEVAFPLVFQALGATLFLELMRLAIVHTPSGLTSAIGIIAGIILGQVALDLGIFVPEVLLYTAITAVAGFATPSYELSLANRFINIILIILASLAGRVGFLIGITGLFLYLVPIKVFGLPYLYPFLPLNLENVNKIIIRHEAKKKKVL